MDTAYTPARHKFTVDDYHKMCEVGILGEDDRTELVDGDLIEMAPVGPRHAGTVSIITEFFIRLLKGAAIVWSQNPITLPPRSEPQPDLVLMRPRADRYLKALPRAEDSLLVVEVSDSTIRFDRLVKQRVYARDGIPEYWIIDLTKRLVEIYRDPIGEQYAEIATARPGERISPVLLPQLVIDVAEIFPDVDAN